MIDDPALNPQSPSDIHAKVAKAHILDCPFNFPTAPLATAAKDKESPLSSNKDRGRTRNGQSTQQPKTITAPEKPSSSHKKMPATKERNETSATRKPNGEANGLPDGGASVAKEAALEQENPDLPVPLEHEALESERPVLPYYAKFPSSTLPPVNTRPIPKAGIYTSNAL